MASCFLVKGSNPSSGSKQTGGDDNSLDAETGESRSVTEEREVEMHCTSMERRSANVEMGGRFSSFSSFPFFSSLESEHVACLKVDCVGRVRTRLRMRWVMADVEGLNPRRLVLLPPRRSFASTRPGRSNRLMRAAA